MTAVLTLEVNPAEPIRIHGSVAGKLRVSSEKRLVVKRVLVRAKWRTGGVGEVRAGVGDDTTLPGFTLESGVPHEASFTVKIPKGPVTLSGSLIFVNWHLEAELDVAWAANPRGTREITVLGASREAPPQLGYRNAAALVETSSGVAQTPPRSSALERLLGRTAAFCAGPALVLILFWAHVFTPAFVAMIGVGIVNFLLLQRWVQTFRSERRFGTLSLAVEPSVVPRGTTLRLRVSIMPSRDRTIDGVDIWLRCAEHAARGTGQHATTHARGDDLGLIALTTTRELKAGKEEVFEGAIFVPETALPSLRLENNTIAWFASVQVQYDGQLLAEQVEIEVTA